MARTTAPCHGMRPCVAMTLGARRWGRPASCAVCAQAGLRGGRGAPCLQEPAGGHGAGRRACPLTLRAARALQSPCRPPRPVPPAPAPHSHLLGPHTTVSCCAPVRAWPPLGIVASEGCHASACLTGPGLSWPTGGQSVRMSRGGRFPASRRLRCDPSGTVQPQQHQRVSLCDARPAPWARTRRWARWVARRRRVLRAASSLDCGLLAPGRA